MSGPRFSYLSWFLSPFIFLSLSFCLCRKEKILSEDCLEKGFPPLIPGPVPPDPVSPEPTPPEPAPPEPVAPRPPVPGFNSLAKKDFN